MSEVMYYIAAWTRAVSGVLPPIAVPRPEVGQRAGSSKAVEAAVRQACVDALFASP